MTVCTFVALLRADPHNPGYLMDILPPSDIPVTTSLAEARLKRQYETLCRLGAHRQPQVNR